VFDNPTLATAAMKPHTNLWWSSN